MLNRWQQEKLKTQACLVKTINKYSSYIIMERVVELVIDEENEFSGIDAISLVENPAIEEEFVALKKVPLLLKEIDPEKRILMGATLIPDKRYYVKTKTESILYTSQKIQ